MKALLHRLRLRREAERKRLHEAMMKATLIGVAMARTMSVGAMK